MLPRRGWKRLGYEAAVPAASLTPKENPPMPELTPTPDPLDDFTSFESTGFRESMLLHVDDPAEREALRQAGCVLYNLILDASRKTHDRITSTQAELRAAQADMVYLRSFLSAIGHGLELSSLPPADAPLCSFAIRLAKQLTTMIDEIDSKLA
jgi:hypothetical protein